MTGGHPSLVTYWLSEDDIPLLERNYTAEPMERIRAQWPAELEGARRRRWVERSETLPGPRDRGLFSLVKTWRYYNYPGTLGRGMGGMTRV